MIRKGEQWGDAPSGPADHDVTGDDVALAGAVARFPRARLSFHPVEASDFARVVGIASGIPPVSATTELHCDALAGHLYDRDVVAVNMIVVGVPPDRQTWRSRNTRVRVNVDGRDVHDGPVTAVVIANGQYLRACDVVPRGHPGDGRVEIHVYMLRRAERRAMRARLATGTHLPHPRIATTSGRRVVVESASGAIPVEVDGAGLGRTARLDVEVTPGAFSLLV